MSRFLSTKRYGKCINRFKLVRRCSGSRNVRVSLRGNSEEIVKRTDVQITTVPRRDARRMNGAPRCLLAFPRRSSIWGEFPMGRVAREQRCRFRGVLSTCLPKKRHRANDWECFLTASTAYYFAYRKVVPRWYSVGSARFYIHCLLSCGFLEIWVGDCHLCFWEGGGPDSRAKDAQRRDRM